MSLEQMDDVEAGSLVRWNVRTNPQVVTEVTDSWFEVKSHSDSYYRFYPYEQYLINKQSDTEYDVYQFKIVGEIYVIGGW